MTKKIVIFGATGAISFLKVLDEEPNAEIADEAAPGPVIDLATGGPAKPRVFPIIEKTRTRSASLTGFVDALVLDAHGETWVGPRVAGCIVRTGRLCFGGTIGAYSVPDGPTRPIRATTALTLNTKHRVLGLDLKPEVRIGSHYVERPAIDTASDPVRNFDVHAGAHLFVGRHITRSLAIEIGSGVSVPVVGPVDLGELKNQGERAIKGWDDPASNLMIHGSVGVRFGGGR